jgi:hypothetical protein
MIWSCLGRRKARRCFGEVLQREGGAHRRGLRINISGIGKPAHLAHPYDPILLIIVCRFLRMTSDASEANKTITFADPPTTTNFVSAKVPARAVNNDIMDVAFVKSVGYYPEGREALLRDHRFADAVPLGKHWSYKYLVDVDGMSYSGRFMAFLASDSAVLKTTVYQEYFSDWIQPWFVVLFSFASMCIMLTGLAFLTHQAALHPTLYVLQGDI